MEVALACRHGAAYDQIRSFAQARGGLILHPYMAIEEIWTLAAQVQRDAGVPTVVLGPPPPVLWVANDKGLLDALIRDVLGVRWVVDTDRGTEIDAVTDALIRMSSRYPWVGLKRTRCASATGNRVFSSSEIEGQDRNDVREQVAAFLHRTEWEEGEEVLIVEWIKSDTSPSTQLWIPPRGSGEPTLDGIYEQVLKGPEKVFVGSRPSRLAEPVHTQMGEASLAIATALQEMGYRGRCSFDFIVEHPGTDDAQARFTECNGRWGGTSTPMHLVDRCVKGARPAYLAQDIVHPNLVDAPFETLLDQLGDHVFDVERQEGTFLLYNPGCLVGSGKIDVVAIGEDHDRATEAMEVLLPQLWGLG